MRPFIELLNNEKVLIDSIIRSDEKINSISDKRDRVETYPDCMLKENDIERYNADIDELIEHRDLSYKQLADIQREIGERIRFYMEGAHE